VWGGGVPLPSGKGVWGKGTAPSPEFFFDFGSQNSELWCILGAIFAVQLVALHAKSSAYERIEQKEAKQGYWKLYTVAFCVELNVTLSFTRCITYTQAKTLRGRKDTLAQVYFYWRGNRPLPDRRHWLLLLPCPTTSPFPSHLN